MKDCALEVREWIGFFSVTADEGCDDLGEQWVVGSADEIVDGVRKCLEVRPVQRVVLELTRNIQQVEHEQL